MLPYDAEKTAEIWKRVQGLPSVEPDVSQLLVMIAQEWADAVTYLHLSRHFRGKDSALLRKMAYEEQAHCTCLKGIYTMITGHHPSVQAPSVSRQPLGQLLRQCCSREQECICRYEDWAKNPEHGASFARLAAEEKEHSHILLQLLGKQRVKR